MSRTCLRRFRLGRSPQLSFVAARRNLHASTCRQGAALDASSLEHDAEKPALSPVTENPKDVVKRQRLQELTEAVNGERGDYGRAWGCYINALNFAGPEGISLELHQKALRRCSLSPWQCRLKLTRSLATGKTPPSSHIHEVRFRAIIHNMRAAGWTPSIDDYNYILQQFAAVGHHTGAVQVLREIVHMKLPRTPKTYGLCLMAMCHRLSLPRWHLEREDLVAEVSTICIKLLKDMWEDGVPVTAMNVDLAIRIFKETMDIEGFERMMKVAYGIDFSYPDRPPVEFWDQDRSREPGAKDLPMHLPLPLPLSTAALNTTIDFLGRAGQISRLVQAFEVLTTPLPSQSPAAPASTYEDDEDDDYGDSNPTVAPFNSPHATPNTTTYYFLLKWISKAGYATMARHYLLQAMELDRTVDRALRGDCMLKSPGEILALHFAVNRGMLLPIFAEANRDKNMELLRWVLMKTQRVLRRKRADIRYYAEVEERWRLDEEAALSTASPAESLEPADAEEVSPSMDVSSSAGLSIPRSSSSSESSPIPSHATESISPNLDVNLETPPEVLPPKVFDVQRHLSILRRDKQQLQQFERHVIDVIGRNTQRMKERLGRRIWAKKDVYLRTQDQRTRLSRTVWREIVNFRPIRLRKQAPAHAPDEEIEGNDGPGQVAAFRGFFTSKRYGDLVSEVGTASESTKPQ